jgi:hypothetical protein
MTPEERPDLATLELQPWAASGSAFDVYADINEELRKLAPDLVMPLIEGHTARTLPFPVTVDEACAMQRVFRKVQTPADDATLGALVARMDAFLEENNFKDEDGNLCAFAKICDVSPKDVLGTTLEDILPRARKYAAIVQSEAPNVHLQSLIYAKATHKPTFMQPGARGIVDLLCRSNRCMGSEGLDIKGYPGNPQHVEITLRDWMRIDPAWELRCFVNKDRLRGISQMSSMDIYGVHYPQLQERRDEIGAGALAFFNEIGPKLAPLSAGLMVPGRYVLDVYFDVNASRWWVVELNPFITSSSGHLFAEDYGDHWEMWNVLEDDPVDVRMHDFTKQDVLEDVPKSWQAYLESSTDTYGPPGEGATKKFRTTGGGRAAINYIV